MNLEIFFLLTADGPELFLQDAINSQPLGGFATAWRSPNPDDVRAAWSTWEAALGIRLKVVSVTAHTGPLNIDIKGGAL